METTVRKAGEIAITSEEQAAQLFAEKMGKLSAIQKNPTLAKAAKLGAKLIVQDAKFLKFINADVEDFEKEIPALMRDEKVMERIAKILNPTVVGSEDYLPNVKNVQTVLDVLTKEFVDLDNHRIAKDYSAIPDEDVQAKVASQLEIRKRVWLRAITNTKEFKNRYGLK